MKRMWTRQRIARRNKMLTRLASTKKFAELNKFLDELFGE